MAIFWPNKNAQDVRDNGIDWSGSLGEQTISTSEWTVPGGLTQGAASFTETETAIRLSGGEAGEVYSLVNTVTTSAGETMRRVAVLPVRRSRA